jgi:hypothetical protein
MLVEANVLLAPAHPKQDIVIKVNDEMIFRVSLTKSSDNHIKIDFPTATQESIATSGLVRIHFQFPNNFSPKDAGISRDNRKLALKLKSITLR